MIDLRQYYLDNVKPDEYYYRFFDLVKDIYVVYNVFSGFDELQENVRTSFEVFDDEEAIEKFRMLCQPDNKCENKDDRCWFYLVSFFLDRNGYYIEEFPDVLRRPPDEPLTFIYNQIRDRAVKLHMDNDGTVTYDARRQIVADLTFVRTTVEDSEIDSSSGNDIQKDDIDVDLLADNDAGDEHIYPLNDIKIEKGFYTVFELKRKKDAPEPRLILDSDFQREEVWGNKRNSELVESVLMGLPLPIFYFSQDRYGRLVVVDGRQRLTALFKYMDNRYSLSGLKVLPELNGKRCRDLSAMQITKIEDFQIQAHVIMPPTPERIKYDIFDRVNRGGMRLNKQEMRNALYQGKATRLLNRIVKNDPFIRATGDAFKNDKRMKDKYLVTRYLAIHLYLRNQIEDNNGEVYTYKGDPDDFLGRAMDHMNQESDDDITTLEKVTDDTLDMVYGYLGSDAFRFRKDSENSRRTPINMSIFETIMIAFEGIQDGLPQSYVSDMIYQVIDSQEFRKNIANHRDSALNLKWRIDKALELKKEFNNL